MRWLLTTALGTLTALAYGQTDEAEKLYRDMEKHVRQAKGIRMVFEMRGTIHSGGESCTVKAAQQFEGRNKARFDLDHEEKSGFKSKVLFVSDGKEMVTIDSETKPEQKPATADLNQGLPAILARGGFMLPRLMTPTRGRFDADKILAVSDFKFGAKERFGKAEARPVEYLIKVNDREAGTSFRSASITLWIDLNNLVPLRRKVTMVDDETVNFVEDYTEFVLNPKFDPKTFELPKLTRK